MPDYKEMYFILMRSQNKAIELMQEAHQKTEEMFVAAKEPELVLLRPDEAEEEPNPPE